MSKQSGYFLSTGEPATLLLELSDMPVCHRFPTSKGQVEQLYPLRLGQGVQSGLVGLVSMPPWQQLSPIYPWVICNEPEEHLDNMCHKLVELLKPAPHILGLSQKDDSTLTRLGALLPDAHLSYYKHEKMQEFVNPGVEVVQGVLCQGEVSGTDVAGYDVIIARHILEHTHDTQIFLKRLKQLLKHDGILVFEVPDNQKAFNTAQHTVIWEEHSLYFTLDSLLNLLREFGFHIESSFRYPQALEDTLVVFAKIGTNEKVSRTVSSRNYSEKFHLGFEQQKRFFREQLTTFNQSGPVAILGAGHLGVAFVNYYALEDLIQLVIDDDPNKHKKFLPGCQLEITSSEALLARGVKLCLLTCNPWNNKKIEQKYSAYIQAGGRFLSIFQPELWR